MPAIDLKKTDAADPHFRELVAALDQDLAIRDGAIMRSSRSSTRSTG